jgi:hypothetical protein
MAIAKIVMLSDKRGWSRTDGFYCYYHRFQNEHLTKLEINFYLTHDGKMFASSSFAELGKRVLGKIFPVRLKRYGMTTEELISQSEEVGIGDCDCFVFMMDTMILGAFSQLRDGEAWKREHINNTEELMACARRFNPHAQVFLVGAVSEKYERDPTSKRAVSTDEAKNMARRHGATYLECDPLEWDSSYAVNNLTSRQVYNVIYDQVVQRFRLQHQSQHGQASSSQAAATSSSRLGYDYAIHKAFLDEANSIQVAVFEQRSRVVNTKTRLTWRLDEESETVQAERNLSPEIARLYDARLGAIEDWIDIFKTYERILNRCTVESTQAELAESLIEIRKCVQVMTNAELSITIVNQELPELIRQLSEVKNKKEVLFDRVEQRVQNNFSDRINQMSNTNPTQPHAQPQPSNVRRKKKRSKFSFFRTNKNRQNAADNRDQSYAASSSSAHR